MSTRKVKVVTLVTEVMERISIIEVPTSETNDSIVRDIEGKIAPASEHVLETDVYDVSAKVVSIDAVELSYDTIMRRGQRGIDLNLPLNFRLKWGQRMPAMTVMVQHGMTLKLIAQHYGCSSSTIGVALIMHNKSIGLIKREYRERYMATLK